MATRTLLHEGIGAETTQTVVVKDESMEITLPPDIEQILAEEARQRGTTAELLALESLRQRFVPQSGQGAPADGHGTLADFLSAHIGVLHSSEEIPGRQHCGCCGRRGDCSCTTPHPRRPIGWRR